MYKIDWTWCFFICFITAIICCIFCYKEKKDNRKILYIFSTLSILIYSGIGISYVGINKSYVHKYFIFLFCLLATIKIVFSISVKKGKNNKGLEKKIFSDVDRKLLKFKKIYIILSVIFISTTLINLIFPTNRLYLLWNPPNSSIVNIFERREAMMNTVRGITNFIGTFLLPFFMIYIYILIKENKRVRACLWVFAWCYLKYVDSGYLGRYEIAIYVLFITLLVSSIKNGKLVFDKKKLLQLGGLFLILAPFFVWYEGYRLGATSDELSLVESILRLMQSETRYPIYYDTISNYGSAINPMSYIVYLILLPIPSFLVPNEISFSVNDIFTSMVTGISRGEHGYSVILPSLLGESFMIWGGDLYWIHAIIIGLIIGIYFRFFEKARILTCLNLYFLITTLLIGRGGSQSFLAVLINSSLSIIVFCFIVERVRDHKGGFNRIGNR